MINTKSVLIQKYRLIFIPFLLTTCVFLVLYTFLHWLLSTKWQILHVKEDYLDFWIPFILPWIAVLTWLRKRICLLQLKRANGKDSTFGIQFLELWQWLRQLS